MEAFFFFVVAFGRRNGGSGGAGDQARGMGPWVRAPSVTRHTKERRRCLTDPVRAVRLRDPTPVWVDHTA